MLAGDNTGYGNLIKLASAGYLEGYYYKPRVDWELLASHSQGLIALSGCLSGRVSKALEEARSADAGDSLKNPQHWKFDTDHFYFKSLPSADIDFVVEGRDRVINYVAEKYGRDRVAQAITFSTKPRSSASPGVRLGPVALVQLRQ